MGWNRADGKQAATAMSCVCKSCVLFLCAADDERLLGLDELLGCTTAGDNKRLLPLAAKLCKQIRCPNHCHINANGRLQSDGILASQGQTVSHLTRSEEARPIETGNDSGFQWLAR